MFYERCGVGTVDISFPSNHLMFSKTIKNMNYFGSKNQFPFIIFKESSDKINKIFLDRQVPDGLGVRIPGFHPGGPGSIPGLGVLFDELE